MLLLGLLLCLPASLPAAPYKLTSETLIRVFERNDGIVVPAYEYLRAEVGDPAEDPLTLHLLAWGRVAHDAGGFFADDADGALLYGYLQYLHPQRGLDLRLGRQHLFEGVANEAADAMRIGADLPRNFSLSVYAGHPVALDSAQERRGDGIWGGRLAHRRPGRYEVGLSFKRVDNDDVTAEEAAGVDLYLALPRGALLSGFSSYNLETEGWGEHSWELRFSLAGFRLRPFFERFAFEDFFATGANTAGPFRFLDETGETLTVYGADVLRRLNEKWEAGLKVKLYGYDRREDSSQFLSLLATRRGEGLSQAGGELGAMAGEAAENRYFLGRAFFYQEQLPVALPIGFLTGDAVFVLYDEAIFDRHSALFLSLGAGRKFFGEALELRLSGDFSRDPFHDEDLRGMLTARYVFAR